MKLSFILTALTLGSAVSAAGVNPGKVCPFSRVGDKACELNGGHVVSKIRLPPHTMPVLIVCKMQCRHHPDGINKWTKRKNCPAVGKKGVGGDCV